MTNKTVKIPELYPATKSSSDAALQAALRLFGIKLLKAPGPESNYLDWEFVLDQFLQANKSKMSSDDVDAHIEEMSTVAEKLNALITPSNPLTADNLHSSALLILLPAD
ncbi:hypothetical protein PCANC_27954 [Puccinia coronata f. sp. avenae]|uniref:Uncharacterized protein n=1 Tax=Puccinia coronata f. sp. avenae TaxID=200324 RepID=A0A2N5TRI4_9BASI|nr:hypothetical protein PCANC_27954 [Puccinia coronata f. sp. avenae]